MSGTPITIGSQVICSAADIGLRITELWDATRFC
jgi:hypothetical protein